MEEYRKKTNHETAWFIILLITLVIMLCVFEFYFSNICDGFTTQDIIHTLMHKRPMNTFLWADFNMYGILAFVLALFSLWYTFLQYKSQIQTERNTSNVSVEDQKGRFRDLARHEYRNLVCVLSTAAKYFGKDNFKDKHPKAYPSESHMLKLQATPEDFVLNINPQMASDMSEMRLVLRNYNIEIRVASEHLSRYDISLKTIKHDYDNLIFKPLFLVRKACNMEIGLDRKEAMHQTSRMYSMFRWLREEWREITSWKKADSTDEEQRKVLLNRIITAIVTAHLYNLPDSLNALIEKNGVKGKNPHAQYLRYLSMMKNASDMTIKGADHTGACERSFNTLFKEKLDKEKKKLLWRWEFKDKEERNSVNRYIEKVLEALNMLTEQHPECDSSLQGYRGMLEHIRNGREIDFKEFFALMLKMDVVVELRKIGMVNFA